ncbi:hypothetical protein BKA93DRAFT_61585 [Sparassis latifolia]
MLFSFCNRAAAIVILSLRACRTGERVPALEWTAPRMFSCDSRPQQGLAARTGRVWCYVDPTHSQQPTVHSVRFIRSGGKRVRFWRELKARWVYSFLSLPWKAEGVGEGLLDRIRCYEPSAFSESNRVIFVSGRRRLPGRRSYSGLALCARAPVSIFQRKPVEGRQAKSFFPLHFAIVRPRSRWLRRVDAERRYPDLAASARWAITIFTGLQSNCLAWLLAAGLVQWRDVDVDVAFSSTAD